MSNQYDQMSKKSVNSGGYSTGQSPNSSSNPKSLPPSSISAEEVLLDLEPISMIYEELSQQIEERGKSPKYPSGIDSLDDVIWGFHKQQLFVLGSRTSMGKSLFAVHMAIQLASLKLKVVYFSLEMSKLQVVERIVTHICHIHNLKLSEGEAKQDFRDGKNLFINWANDNRLLIDDKYGYEFEKLIEVCKVTAPDFVIIDHIQMIRSTGKGGKLEAIEEYMRRLKQLALEWNFGIILLSQINRGGINNPGIEFLKWGGILEELADVCIIINTDWDSLITHFNVAKQRHRGTATLDLKIQPQYSKFVDRMEDYDADTH